MITVTIKNDQKTSRLLVVRKVEDKAERETKIEPGRSEEFEFEPGRDLSSFTIELEKK